MSCSSGQFDNYGPDYSDIRKLQEEIDTLTAVLCEFLHVSKEATGDSFEKELQEKMPITYAWWQNHQERDRIRQGRKF